VLRSHTRLGGWGGVGVSLHNYCQSAGRDFPHPPGSYERVDLPRKRER
jgi:hypothetical protein